MQRLIPALVCCFAGLTSRAAAAPILLDKSESVAEARRDPGNGICGSVTKFNNQPAPLLTIDDAVGLLNRPVGDPNIQSRVSRLFQIMNFSVGSGSEADFSAPSASDDIFPSCQDPLAMPMGADDNNIAMRIRGYLNITNTRGGQPVTFAIKCDDGCALWLGKNRQLITQANDDSPQLTGRRARWVSFKDPGLYPVEIVYFQNATTGYLEWSRALSSIFSGDDVAVDDVQWGQQAASFQPLTGTDLYSAIIGSNPSCVECGASGPLCATGNYCGDGLCQACNVSAHCGPTCQTCPLERHICSAGKCVQCVIDAMCSPGSACDLAAGTCLPPKPCMSNSSCGPPQVCRPEGFCGPGVTLCQSDSQCLPGQVCNCDDYSTSCRQAVCITPPTPCPSGDGCPEHYYCDGTVKTCRLQSRYEYQGGLTGCAMSTTSTRRGPPMIALLGLALLGLGVRLRRRSRG